MLATTDVEFPWHSRHVSFDVALLCAENVFATHEVHTAEPIESLYFPSWHAKQAVCDIDASPFATNSANVM
jgi:hypothetical protein